jgi:hypothetical protein
MNNPASPSSVAVPLSGERRVNERCDRFEAAWKAGEQPRIEGYLADTPEPECSYLLRELLALELEYRRKIGETPTEQEYRQWFPDHAALVLAVFNEEVAGGAASSHPEVSTGPEAAQPGEADAPVQLGRYRITAKPDCRTSTSSYAASSKPSGSCKPERTCPCRRFPHTPASRSTASCPVA